MHKKYIGKNREENLDWLLNVWLKEGPPVCFLQGFSGVGKTDLARDFCGMAESLGKCEHAVINEIADRAAPSVLESLMELSIVLSQQGLADMEALLFEQANPNFGSALEKALQRSVVIIFDEAQRLFLTDSGTPLPQIKSILEFLRTRPSLPGRLLLLSDRIVDGGRWSEWIPKLELTALKPDEAIEAFDTKLNEVGVCIDIPRWRKEEIVRDLDFNPRAIEALVGALRYDSLDEIIGSNPGLWAVRDRDVSRHFLRALERDLLERTMRHLDIAHQRKLWHLAVHRRNFRREALEQLCTTKEEATDLRTILLTRFLLNFYKGVLVLNPIVREISLGHLKENPSEFRKAHSRAADYHLRHFKPKQIIDDHEKLGESFAELRYHLVMAGRLDELTKIGHRFTDHLKRELNSSTPVPIDREELEERIGVLSVLLEDKGAKGLEYHLARCLQARSNLGDIQLAIEHAENALGSGAREVNWHLLAELKLEAEGVDAAVAVIRRGLNSLQSPDASAPLYQFGAEIFAKAGRDTEAASLLRKGILTVPPGKNLFSLYQLMCEVLCRGGKPLQAIAVAMEGFSWIPERAKRYKLAEAAIYLCAGTGNPATLGGLTLPKAGVTFGQQQMDLARVLQRQMNDDWRGAADAARVARREFPDYFALCVLEAFSRLALGEAASAWHILGTFPKLTYNTGDPHVWLAVFIHLRRQSRTEAHAMLMQYMGRPIHESRELNEKFLLRLWDEQEVGPECHRLCFQFPRMPASLTGLKASVWRVPFAKPVLSAGMADVERREQGTAKLQESAEHEIYVSYAWGEDSTVEGQKREEIVDRLCDAIRSSGREIARDKKRLSAGESIERFAQEISRARCIIAVISTKFLHSEFCMPQELFRAYRRCDFQRDEFQKKVIALVIDDAVNFFTEKDALVSLASHWKEKTKRLRNALETIDPTRRSSDVWKSVELQEDMVPFLPEMLMVLRDIIMKRGFEDIVADGFQEVISRLPTHTSSNR